MSRATPVRYDDADPDQREVWDSIVESRGDPSRLVGPDGGLVGPFNAMVTSPGIGGRMAAMGAAVRFHNQLEPRLKELAICATGARWKSEFEWWAHRRIGSDAGLDDSVLDALAEGRRPDFEREDEAVIHAFASQLAETGRVDTDRYEAVRNLVGERAVVDLIMTIGYYTLVSFTLNALEVPLPQGAQPIWAPVDE